MPKRFCRHSAPPCCAPTLSTPVRDAVERIGLEDGFIYVDLPAPVDRAWIGDGVDMLDIEYGLTDGVGLLCLQGDWLDDAIVLTQCFPEDRHDIFRELAPEFYEGADPVLVDPDAEP